MQQITKLNVEDKLPLTCSRTGTCCHGKLVQLNPWEILCFAKEKKISPREFRDQYCDFCGIRLKFNGKPGWKNLPACSQYIENFGCSVHLGRPLACRLYPLGRQKQAETVDYIFQGSEFPCLEGCPEVKDLPQLSVGEYIKGQATSTFEAAQDAYLEIMQNLADIAFVLLLDTGLSKSGNKETLRLWRKMGKEDPQQLADRISSDWMDDLMLPEITDSEANSQNPEIFANHHNILLQSKAQESFGFLTTNKEFSEASCLMMALALHLARGLGANPKTLSERWINTAKKNGAFE